mmetsp:Transcript_3378/g.6288  ORF Transcript_3378/g.6288 Transcript_3378/m.6288 type:complete len:213 (-) Transcript_3378:243-881(-)
MLAENGEFDGSSPVLRVQNPLTVLDVRLTQERLAESDGVGCNSVRNDTAKLGCHLAVALHDVPHRVEEAAVVRVDDSAHHAPHLSPRDSAGRGCCRGCGGVIGPRRLLRIGSLLALHRQGQSARQLRILRLLCRLDGRRGSCMRRRGLGAGGRGVVYWDRLYHQILPVVDGALGYGNVVVGWKLQRGRGESPTKRLLTWRHARLLGYHVPEL